MKKTLTTLLALAATVAVGTAASAADKLTLQLKSVSYTHLTLPTTTIV